MTLTPVEGSPSDAIRQVRRLTGGQLVEVDQ